MLRHIKLSVVALIVAMIASPALARPQTQWVQLGEQKVGLLDDGDVIPVGAGEGPFLTIKLRATGNDIDVRLIRIRFLNGEEQTIRLDEVIRQNGESREYDLQGERRGVREVLVRYNGRNLFGGSARLAVMAEKVVGPPPGPPPGAGAGRLDIIDRQVADNSADRIEFRVGPQDGRLSRIAVRAVDGPLTFRNVRVTFGNGETQAIDITERLEPGQESRLMDLEGDRRIVTAVSLEKRPSWRQGSTRVELIAERRPAPPPPSAGGRPDIIDTQTVDAASDRIVFRVGPRDGRLSKIAIRAIDAPLTFRNIQVVFGNGETQNIDVIQRLEPGEESAIFDLTGDQRVVDQVIVQKRPSWRPGASRAELIGFRRPAPPPPAPPSAGGFDIVDSVVVDKRSDRVEFRVPRGEGPFTRIKFHAADDAITFRHIQIVFANGETQEIDLLERLNAGEESPAIDVQNGERRNIERVVVTKRPSWSAGQARLQLLGFEPPRRPAPPPAPPPRPSGPPSHGYPPGWVLIGAGPIQRGFQDRGPGSPAGVVTLQVGRDVGQFDKIGIRLVGEYIKIRQVTAIYGNGERERIGANINLLTNQRTQPLKLRSDRFVRAIEIEYFAGLSGKTYLEVYGDYADGWLGDRGRRRDYNQGWVMLGAQRALMFSNDVDSFIVGERYGRFKGLRVTARQHDIKFYGMRVIYGNGEVEDVPFVGELSDGQSSPALNLRGQGRFIDRIELKYRTRLNFKGEGTVEVWGLQ